MTMSDASPVQQPLDDSELHTVDLRNSSLSYVPYETFSSFRDIRKLDLRRNLLTFIPPEIVNLDCLVEALFDHNNLMEVPQEIFEMSTIERIGLSDNRLTKIQEIGPCPNLRSLNLSDNWFEECPIFAEGACRKLKTLHLHHNSFSRLHTSFSQLESLEELSLEWFRYTTPPLSRVIRKKAQQAVITELRQLCKDKGGKGGCHIYDVIAAFSTRAFDVHGKDPEGRTRLHVACAEGHIGVAMGLLESRADCNKIDHHHFTPLLFAVSNANPRLVAKLLPHSEIERSASHLSPIHFCATYPNSEIMQLLLSDKRKLNVNQKDLDANNPLHVIASIFDRHYPAVCAVGNLLLEHQVDLNGYNKGGYSPLQVAASTGQYLGVKWLMLKRKEQMEKGALDDCGRSNHDKEFNGGKICVDIDARGGWGQGPNLARSALAMAVTNGRARIVQCLLESAADPWIKDAEGMPVRHHAKGSTVILKLVRRAEDMWMWFRVHRELASFRSTNSSGQSPPAQPYQRDGHDPKSPDCSSPNKRSDGSFSFTPLSSPHKPPRLPGDADEDPDPSPVKPLDPNPTNPESPVPLSDSDEFHNFPETDSPGGLRTVPLAGPGIFTIGAGLHGSLDCENELAEVVTVPEVQAEVKRRTRAWQYNPWDIPDLTDLLMSTETQISEMPKDMFIKNIIPIFANGQTHRIMYILTKSWGELERFLTTRDGNLLTPMMYLCLRRNEDCLRFLCSKLSSQDKRVASSLTTQHTKQTLVHLVVCGPDGFANSPRKSGRQSATSSSNHSSGNSNNSVGSMLSHESAVPDCLEILFNTAWFSLDARDEAGNCALHVACENNDVGAIQVLLEHGGDPNVQTAMTLYTPLHVAIRSHNIAAMIQLLHCDRTNVNLTDRMDWPPIFEACHVCDTVSVGLLANGGARLDFMNAHGVSVYGIVEASKKHHEEKCFMAAFLAGNGAPVPTSDLLQASKDWEDTRHIARPRPVLIAAEREIKSQQSAYQSRPHYHGNDDKPPCFLPGTLSPRCQTCKGAFNITSRQNNCQSCGTCLCNSCTLFEEVEVVCLYVF